jgi:hypothetical protein
MLWFQKSRTESVETVSPVLHFKMDRLAQVELEFRKAEQNFNTACTAVARYRGQHRQNQPFALAGKIFLPVNPHQDQELGRLEREVSRASLLRNSLLAERASLRKDLGIQ